MKPNANYATDKQTYAYQDGSSWEFRTHVNFDEVIRALSARARKSKTGRATALRGAIVVLCNKVPK